MRLTTEELKSKYQPTASSGGTSTRFTTDELKAKYAAPSIDSKQPKKNLMESIGGGLDAVFGGGKIGEAIGTQVAKSNFKPSSIPEADRARAAEIFKRRTGKDIDFSAETERKDIEQSTLQGPTAAQLGGDAAKIGLTLGSLALPVLKGASVANAIPGLAGKPLAAMGTAALGNVGITGGLSAGLGAAEAVRDQDPDILGRAASAGLTGAAVSGGLSAVGTILGRGVPAVYRTLAKTFAQTPEKAIERFASNPTAGRAALTRAVNDETMIYKIADAAQDAVDDIQKAKTKAFGDGLSKIGAEKLKLDPSITYGKMQKVLEDAGIVSGKKINIEQVLTDDAEINAMRRIIARINSQKDFSVPSMLKLKTYIQNQYRPTGNREFNAITTRLANAVKDQMPLSVKKLLQQSQADEMLLGQLKKEFGLSRGAQGLDIATDEGKVVLRENTQKVINALRRAFSDKNDTGAILLKELERKGGAELIDDIAAQFFKSTAPPGGLQSVLGLGAGSVAALAGAVVNPATLLGTLPTLGLAGIPRVVGEMSIRSGAANKALQPLQQPLGRAIRAGIGAASSKRN